MASFTTPLKQAFRDAGVRTSKARTGVCAIHHDLNPCLTCDHIFTSAERQRVRQRRAAAREAHAAYLLDRGGRR